MTKIIEFLKGKKTFIVAIIMVIVSGLKAQGYIDDATYGVILGFLGALGLTALRLGINGK